MNDRESQHSNLQLTFSHNAQCGRLFLITVLKEQISTCLTLTSWITRISHACEDEFLFVQNSAAQIVVGSGRRVLPLLSDMTKTDTGQQAIDTVIKDFSRIDVLISCLVDAFRQPLTRLQDSERTSISDEYLKKIIDVNLIAFILCTRAIGLNFPSWHIGKMVNIASLQRGKVVEMQ